MTQEEFDAFYAASFARLVGQIYAMCGSVAEAQDCVQEAFVRAWDRRRSLDVDQSPEAWVRTVAYRLAVSRWRRARRPGPGEPGLDGTDQHPDRPAPASLPRTGCIGWLPVKVSAGSAAGFAELVWRPAGESDNGYFESVGLALVEDRLAVTVSLVYGQDYNRVGYREDGGPANGLPPHPQYGLVKAAADRLVR